jgi:L-serine dehydratase
MEITDIIGPVMIGPSSSHTAGAVKLGNMAKTLCGGEIKKAVITLYGSFAKTGAGHGTDKALIAGLLGFAPDDARIKNAFELAPFEYEFRTGENEEYHPNTAVFEINGTINIRGTSVGGGAVEIREIDGMEVSFTGKNSTLAVFYKDRKGVIAEISEILSDMDINIAFMRTFRTSMGGNAIAVIEIDGKLKSAEKFKGIEYVDRVVYYEKQNA